MQRLDTPLSEFIEDLTTLDILSTDSAGISLAKHKSNGQYYLLIDHLALSINSRLINPQTQTFNDGLNARAKREHLTKIYNPFRPDDYSEFGNKMLYDATRWPELNRTGWKFHIKKRSYTIDYRDADFYVIDSQFPWLGINITNEFGLRLCSYGLFGHKLVSSDGSDATPAIRDLLSKWTTARNNSQFPPSLQAVVHARRTELETKIRKERDEALAKNKHDAVIREILGTEAYKRFVKYINLLASDNDPLAKQKAKTFGDFLSSLRQSMSAAGLEAWLIDATNFKTKFAGKFEPCPGLGKAKAPEETTCYEKFNILAQVIQNVLNYYQYVLPKQADVKQEISNKP